MVIGSGCVTMNCEESDDPGALPDGSQHDASRGARGVAERYSIGLHGLRVIFQNQLSPTLKGPAHQWRRRFVLVSRWEIHTPAVDRVPVQHVDQSIGFWRVQIHRARIPS